MESCGLTDVHLHEQLDSLDFIFPEDTILVNMTLLIGKIKGSLSLNNNFERVNGNDLFIDGVLVKFIRKLLVENESCFVCLSRVCLKCACVFYSLCLLS